MTATSADCTSRSQTEMLVAMTADEEERRRQAGLRMRAAREAAGLSQQEAANRFTVDKSTVYRWERKGIIPRDSWPAIQTVYNTTRQAIEFGVADAGDPPYEAWQQFLDWLETATERPAVKPWMVADLSRWRMLGGRTPTVDTYKLMLHGLFAANDRTEDAGQSKSK
jgi:transcriptional regulator with XRE-family HTH domain